MAEKEIWKKYPEFDFIEVSNLGRVRTKDRYVQVKGQGKRLIRGRILKQNPDHGGYLLVHFNVNGKGVTRKVHRMVAITFIKNPHNYPEVNHLDCNRKNNCVSNLEWCTPQYNTAYKEKYGTSSAEAVGRSVTAIDINNSRIFRFETLSDAGRKLNISVQKISDVLEGRRNQAGGYLFTDDESKITEEKMQEIRASMHSFEGVIAINQETSEVFWFKSQSEAARQLGFDGSHITSVVRGKQYITHGHWFCNADSTAVEKTRSKFGDEVADKVERLLQGKQ